MKIDSYTKEMMDESSFIDMSYIYLQEVGKDTNLYDIIDKFKEIGGYNDDEIENRILQFYTDLNTDGRFLTTENGVWGLRDWYSVSEISENISPTIHKYEAGEEEIEIEDEDEDFFKTTDDDEEEDPDKTVDDDVEIDDEVEDVETEIEYDDTDDLEDNYDDDNEDI